MINFKKVLILTQLSLNKKKIFLKKKEFLEMKKDFLE